MNTITLRDADGGEHVITQNLKGQTRTEAHMLDGTVYTQVSTPAETAMFHRLLELSWRPATERPPTEEDANECGDVDWSDGEEIWEGNYDHPGQGATHWRRIVLP